MIQANSITLYWKNIKKGEKWTYFVVYMTMEWTCWYDSFKENSGILENKFREPSSGSLAPKTPPKESKMALKG